MPAPVGPAGAVPAAMPAAATPAPVVPAAVVPAPATAAPTAPTEAAAPSDAAPTPVGPAGPASAASADGHGVKRGGFTAACIVFAVLAGICLLGAFSQPSALIGAAAFGAYAYHLYRGGREFLGHMADGRRRSRSWVVWAFAALIAVSTGFQTSPLGFLAAIALAGLAAHRFRGGRESVTQMPDGRRRSAAWVYYGVIAMVLAIGGPALGVLGGLLVAIVPGAYAVYLFRGGRYVLWVW